MIRLGKNKYFFIKNVPDYSQEISDAIDVLVRSNIYFCPALSDFYTAYWEFSLFTCLSV
jgi:hypothetical protein